MLKGKCVWKVKTNNELFIIVGYSSPLLHSSAICLIWFDLIWVIFLQPFRFSCKFSVSISLATFSIVDGVCVYVYVHVCAWILIGFVRFFFIFFIFCNFVSNRKRARWCFVDFCARFDWYIDSVCICNFPSKTHLTFRWWMFVCVLDSITAIITCFSYNFRQFNGGKQFFFSFPSQKQGWNNFLWFWKMRINVINYVFMWNRPNVTRVYMYHLKSFQASRPRNKFVVWFLNGLFFHWFTKWN